MKSHFFNNLFTVTDHTDYIMPEGTFFAYNGANTDGINFIPCALSKGVKTIYVAAGTIIPQDIEKKIIQHNAILKHSDCLDNDFASIAAQNNNNPEKKLKIIGITGTKGKTSTTLYLSSLLRSYNKKTALISTAYNQINDVICKTDFTTPKADYIYAFLAECVEQNIEYVIMEVSAQALSRKRTMGIKFEGIIFTNFSQEHGEFYSCQDDYFNAKCMIYDQVKKNGFLIINYDDQRIYQSAYEHAFNNEKSIIGYGLNTNAEITISMIKDTFKETEALLHYKKNNYYISTELHGIYNYLNCSAVFGAIIKLLFINETDYQEICNKMKMLEPAQGRSERYILDNNRYVCIDRAHTPSSFEAILKTFRSQTSHLIVLFGCGGNRDTTKRPLMATIAEQYADVIYLTMDNPRTESFSNITHDIIKGFSFTKPIHIITNREDAIKDAYNTMKEYSILALLGKGGELYQIIGKEKIYFSEKDILHSIKQKENNI
jgi:UDP-N-acetylmuramoyl-L-alanyl-D-glutamate--2,6-diaminopimelate ligase